MHRDIRDVLVVGGGDVGMLTALSLRKVDEDLRIRIVDDFDSPPPRVGKSTYLAIMPLLHGFLDIEEKSFVQEVKPVWKGSIWFRNWVGQPDFHYPFDDGFPAFEEADRHELLHSIYREPRMTTSIGEEIVEQRKAAWNYNPRGGGFQRYQEVAYHLPIDRFRAFLKDRCEQHGIDLIDDRIEGATVDNHRVESVNAAGRSYEADLYIDASGFGRVVRGEFSELEFTNFDLPLDRAVRTARDRDLKDVIPATIVEGRDDGWCWTIDTYDIRDRGFVYASEFTDDETAAKRLLSEVEGDLTREELDFYRFRSGFVDEPWVENHVTIGNAAGFVEPLQSTALTTNLRFAKFLAYMLNTTGYRLDQKPRSTYNRFFRTSWNNIYSFISIHYKFNDLDTPFWNRVRSVELPPLAAELCRIYDEHGLSHYENPKAAMRSDENGSVLTGSPFGKEDFFHMLTYMGVDSAYHESLEDNISPSVMERRRELQTDREARVADFHDYVEFYNVMGGEGTVSEMG